MITGDDRYYLHGRGCRSENAGQTVFQITEDEKIWRMGWMTNTLLAQK
jgi:hypothetical protein